MMRERPRNTLTPLLDMSVRMPKPALLLEEVITLPPGKEHKVDGILRIRNATSPVDPGRRGIYVLAGREDCPLLEESVFFGHDEKLSIGYLGQRIIVESSAGYGITLRIGY